MVEDCQQGENYWVSKSLFDEGLIDAFIQKFNAKMGKQIVGLSDQALRLLLKHDYPGNVRELENIIEHAFVLCKGNRIDVDCLSKELTMKQVESSFYFSTT